MKSYVMMGYGKFKKKIVQVEHSGNLISGKKVVIIDADDYMVMVALLGGITRKNKNTRKLWNIVKSNELNISLSELIDKMGFKIEFDEDWILVPK
jgi:hypothetical protein